jgi:hypothetical protein
MMCAPQDAGAGRATEERESDLRRYERESQSEERESQSALLEGAGLPT